MSGETSQFEGAFWFLLAMAGIILLLSIIEISIRKKDGIYVDCGRRFVTYDFFRDAVGNLIFIILFLVGAIICSLFWK